MEDSSLFLQWAMNTLRHEQAAAHTVSDDCRSEAAFPSLQAIREASQVDEMVKELIAEAPARSWSSGSGDTTDGSGGGGGNNSAPAVMDHDAAWPASSATTRRVAPTRSGTNTTTNPPLSWNFSVQPPGSDAMLAEAAAAARGLPDLVVSRSPPARRAGLKSPGSLSSSPYAQDHIMAERKRREKINQRFIELSTVIPGLKKMDKATILSDATRYVKELQQKIKDLQAAGGGSNKSRRCIETVVLVKQPCVHGTAEPDDDDASQSPLSSSSSGTPVARKQLPEIEARFSEGSVMVRIHCEDAKGLVVRLFAEVDELHLAIIHANVMPFPSSTLIITITAKVEDGFTITAEEIVDRLNSALLHQQSSCNSAQATEN